jgi:maleylacetoacetate isomerase/maleylpyruvate isomerase
MPFKLYTFFRSSASYRVRIALNLKQVDYESVGRHLRLKEHRSPEYLALNPQGLVPTLDHDGRYISQSLAIIEYLDEIVPEPRLLPDSAYGRAVVRSMAQVVACDTHPLCNLRVLQYLSGVLKHDEDTVKVWYRHWVGLGLEGLEGLVAQHHAAGPYCFGAEITVADVCLIPQLHNARRFECDLSSYPLLNAVAQALEEHPAFAAARPDVQPDAD